MSNKQQVFLNHMKGTEELAGFYLMTQIYGGKSLSGRNANILFNLNGSRLHSNAMKLCFNNIGKVPLLNHL